MHQSVFSFIATLTLYLYYVHCELKVLYIWWNTNHDNQNNVVIPKRNIDITPAFLP